MKTKLITILLFICGLNSHGQLSYPTRDSIHIFWQPSLKITYKDYIGIPQKEIEDLMEKYGFYASASVGIWSVLDVPKKQKDRYRKFERVYFAPAFERTTSFTKTNDTLQIAMQNTFLDICEIWARWARQRLISFQDSTKATGSLSLLYMTVKQDMDTLRLAMFRSYFKEVFIDKKEGAFGVWRTLIEKMLNNKKEWATKPEECYRLMTDKPIEKDYIKAPKVVGYIFNNKDKNTGDNN